MFKKSKKLLLIGLLLTSIVAFWGSGAFAGLGGGGWCLWDCYKLSYVFINQGGSTQTLSAVVSADLYVPDGYSWLACGTHGNLNLTWIPGQGGLTLLTGSQVVLSDDYKKNGKANIGITIDNVVWEFAQDEFFAKYQLYELCSAVEEGDPTPQECLDNCSSTNDYTCSEYNTTVYSGCDPLQDPRDLRDNCIQAFDKFNEFYGISSDDCNSSQKYPWEWRWAFGYTHGTSLKYCTEADPASCAEVDDNDQMACNWPDFWTYSESNANCSNTPVAVEDSYTVAAGKEFKSPRKGNILYNDYDENKDTLTAVLWKDVDCGNLTLNPDGSFTFVAPDTPGTCTFEYRAFDGIGYSGVKFTYNSDNELTGVSEEGTKVFFYVQ